jgi:predicted component of type VI protein secretion system
MSTLYVFALVAGKAGSFSAAGHRIEFVKADAVYAAVERLDERPAVSEAALRTQHDIVVRIAAKVDAVLPARFGSLVDLEELERVVELRREAIRDALDLVRGRAQMTVRLFDAEAQDAAVNPLAHAATVATSGTHYLQARRQAAVRALPQAVAAITAAVKDIVAAERSEAGQGRVAATVYHLVDCAAVEKYRRRLAGISSGPDGQTLTVSGPWPPFAFGPELWP